jgi:hypothetical protein
MSEQKFVLRDQDDQVTFRTWKSLMTKVKQKTIDDSMATKTIINAGIVLALSKNKKEIENILRKEGLGGEIK